VKLPAKYAEARRAIAAAARYDEVKKIRDQSIAMGVYAFQCKDRELVVFATEMRKRAERRLGELMENLRKAGQLAEGTRGSKVKGARVSKKPTLASQGIEKSLADRARKAAAMPEEKFEQSVARDAAIAVAAVENSKEVVKAARREEIKAKLKKRKQRHREIRTSAVVGKIEGRFPLIYADPPWHFETYTPAGGGRAPDNHYPTLDDQSIVDFAIDGRPIREVAHADAALFLWCTSSNIELALRVMAGWGFAFKASAVWVKDRQGMGLIFRNWHEVLLYGSRGLMPGPLYVPPSVFNYPRRGHSEKPHEIRAEIEKMYPAFDEQSRLELFARGSVPGWSVYGYESNRVAA